MGADAWQGQQLLDEREQMEMGVHKKLMQARIALQSMKLDKSGHNKFAGYKYFELGDFIPAVQSIFADLGLCGVISYGQDEARLVITDTDDGGSITVTSPMSTAALKGCHEVQNLGAVQTYIRRYLWVTAMEIVEHDAIDSTTGKKTDEPGDKGARISEAELMDWVLSISKTTDLESLKAVYEPAYKKATAAKDKEAAKVLIKAKDMQKAELAVPA